MPHPCVSVIIPSYNSGKYLVQSVESILLQTFNDLELIVVDDGSTDRSLEKLKSLNDPRLIILAHQHNSGYAAAMNTGIAQARGKYIARMDADDISLRERLEKQVLFLEAHPDFCFVGTRGHKLTPNGRLISTYPMDEDFVIETWQDLMNSKRLFIDPSVVIARELVHQVGGYRTYQRSGMDVDLWLRVLELGRPMVTLTEPLYAQRLHPKSITYSVGIKIYNQLPRTLALQRVQAGTDEIVCWSQMSTSLSATASEIAAREAKRWRARQLWRLGATCVEAKDYRGGWSFIAEALRLVEPGNYYLKSSVKGVIQTVIALLHSFSAS